MNQPKGHVTSKTSKKVVGNGLAIRDDGVLCPLTENILKQPNMKRYDGPMTPDFIGAGPDALANRLRHLDGKTAATKRAIAVAQGQPFDIANASKDEILEFIYDEYGEKLDARQNIQTVRKQARDIVSANQSEVAQ